MKRSIKEADVTNVIALPAPAAVPIPQIGRIVKVSSDGRPQVLFDGAVRPVVARVLAPLDVATLRAMADREAEVFLFFDRGDPRRPIIAGVLMPETAAENVSETVEATVDLPEFAHVDGKRVAVRGQDEVVLSCGKASITLRRNGRVIIKGTQIESRAAGANKVRGGSVRIN